MGQLNGPGRRAIRVANCSGAKADPGYHMLDQAKYGDVDVITGDYLAGAESIVYHTQENY